MSRVRECFVCGRLLAQTEKQRVEVRHGRGAPMVLEVCQECWWQVRGKRLRLVVKNGKTYKVSERRSQLELFKAAARATLAGGGRHG